MESVTSILHVREVPSSRDAAQSSTSHVISRWTGTFAYQGTPGVFPRENPRRTHSVCQAGRSPLRVTRCMSR